MDKHHLVLWTLLAVDTVLHATCSHRPLPPWKLADLGMWIPWASLVTGWKRKIRKFPVQTLWQKVSVVTPIISKLQCELRQPRELGKRNMTEKCLSQQPFLHLLGRRIWFRCYAGPFLCPSGQAKGVLTLMETAMRKSSCAPSGTTVFAIHSLHSFL